MAKKKQASVRAVDNLPANAGPGHRAELIPSPLVREMSRQANDMLAEWERATIKNLTLLQRRRKIGPGNVNYGFVDQVSDIAEANPEYAAFINLPGLDNAIRNVEACRDLSVIVQSLARSIGNVMLVYSTVAFDLALDYYNQVKLRANRGDPTAIELYRTLRTRFKKTKRRTGAEPTVKEIERDVRAILTHKKDGEVTVKGKSPKMSAGRTEVIDNVHTESSVRGKAKFKRTAEQRQDN